MPLTSATTARNAGIAEVCPNQRDPDGFDRLVDFRRTALRRSRCARRELDRAGRERPAPPRPRPRRDPAATPQRLPVQRGRHAEHRALEVAARRDTRARPQGAGSGSARRPRAPPPPPTPPGQSSRPTSPSRRAPSAPREHAADRPQPGRRAQLADGRMPLQLVARHLPRRREHRDAIGRSNPEPSFRSSAGARLTVTRRRGNSSSADAIPLRTRSRASFSALSASPTIANAGTPSWMCASTSTRRGSSPTSACVTARASTPRRYGKNRHESVPISC